MSGVVRESAGDGIVVVTLNRPERLNALDSAAKRALGALWEECEADDEVLAVVVRGSGERAFCAGSDVQEIRATGEMVTTDVLAAAIPGIGHDLTKPVVAALHGFTIGMGLTLAVHCDVRLAHPRTRLGFPETQHGMLSGISAITLPAIVGESTALDLMLSGRIVTADEALTLGLVGRVVDDPFAAALDTARRWAANSSTAVRMTKRLVLAERRRRVREHLALVERLRREVTGSREYQGVVAGSRDGRIRDADD